MKQHFDTIVAGAGLAGLIAANRLAGKGQKVLLLERSSHPGGRARTKQAAALLNQGAHAVYRKGALALAMNELGLPVQGGSVTAGGAWLMDGGTLFPLPASAGSLVKSGTFRKRLLPNLIRIYAGLLAGTPRADESFGQWLERHGAKERVKDFFLMLTRLSTYSAAPADMPALQIQHQFKKSMGGVIYPHGGWQTMVDGLTARFVKHGGVMRQEEPITGFQGQSRIEIETTKEELTADHLVLAMDPVRIRQMRPDLLQGFEPQPVRAACLDLVMTGLPDPEKLIALDLHRPLYLSVHSAWANLGGIVIHNLRYLKSGESASREEMEAWADSVQPGFKQRVLFTQFLPSMHVTESAADKSLGHPRIAENVYACGDWVGGDMLSDASAASAMQCASLILDKTGRQAA